MRIIQGIISKGSKGRKEKGDDRTKLRNERKGYSQPRKTAHDNVDIAQLCAKQQSCTASRCGIGSASWRACRGVLVDDDDGWSSRKKCGLRVQTVEVMLVSL
jgi:hypothetical protein